MPISHIAALPAFQQQQNTKKYPASKQTASQCFNCHVQFDNFHDSPLLAIPDRGLLLASERLRPAEFIDLRTMLAGAAAVNSSHVAAAETSPKLARRGRFNAFTLPICWQSHCEKLNSVTSPLPHQRHWTCEIDLGEVTHKLMMFGISHWSLNL